ncbi:MAG: sigma-70 family RNA polymerase sigma factor [Deltaproteobacteria bacterium]|nr:sigma-70 family RNA polymerase sigma factor [Deltaproteobacteria bacterium]
MTKESSIDNRIDPDSELMNRFAAGDKNAFDLLVQKHRKRVINIAHRFFSSHRDDAEDVAQDVFLKVYKSANKYKSTALFSTWLHRITVNTCLNELRKRKVRSLFQLKKKLESEVGAISQYSGSDNEAEIIDKVKEAISQLPPSQKMAIILRRYEELSYDEIGKAMNISIPAVKSLIFRGMNNLKKKLAREEKL